MINSKKNVVLIAITAIFFFAAIVIVFVLLSLNEVIHFEPHALGLQFDLACAFLTISIIIVLVCYILVRKKFDLFEFPVWFTLNIYVQIILNIWLFQRDYHFYSPWITQPEKIAVQIILLYWVSLLIVWLTYFWRIRSCDYKVKSKTTDQSKPRLKLIFSVWSFTWLINLIFTMNGAQGYLNSQTSFSGGNYLYFVNLINDLATFNLMIYCFKNPTKWGKVWIIFVVASSLLVGLIIGSKGAIFIILYLIMCYFYAYGHLPKTWLVIGLIGLFLVVPLVNNFRVDLFNNGYSRRTGASFIDRIPILQNTIDETITQPLSSLLNQTRNTFEDRQGSIFEVTGAYLTVHPNIKPFVFFDMVDAVGTFIVPRIFWSDKPSARPKIYNVSTNYLGAKEELSYASSGQIADAYRGGGIVFLLFWLILLTFIYTWLYRIGPNIKSTSGTAFYLVVLTGIITYDGDIFPTVMKILQFGIFLFIFNKYVLYADHKVHKNNI